MRSEGDSEVRRPGRFTAAQHGIQLILVPVLFYLGAKLSLAFAMMPEVVVMLWIPNSILLATLLHYHGRRYALFAALIIVAEIAADYPTFSLIEAVLFGVINLLEVTIAYLILRRWRFDPRFATPNDIAKFVMAAPVTAAFTSACAAAATYSYFRAMETDFVEVLRLWWLSDGLGLLILTPLVLSLWPPMPGTVEERVRLRWYDGIAFVVGLAIVVAFAFSRQRMFYGMTIRAFLLIPPVLYAAARFSMRTVTMVVATFTILLVYVTRNGQQPFGDLPIRETVASGQELIFVMSVMALGIAALLTQQRAAARQLKERIRDRTIELSAANRQLQELAVTDPLTGICNRRALFDLLKREIDREHRHPHGLAVILFDLDHFKEVNDLYGHAAGDLVLRHVAEVVGTAVRTTDTLARYGGEEFVLIAPETDEANALLLAERMRSTLRSAHVAVDDKELRVTASFGVAMLHPEDQQPEQVLGRADQALYAAKAAGRDRVVAGTPSAARPWPTLLA
ncbi:MAG TPA: diguanylate cyclase [Thermoanaerobaculia bacterium]